MAQAGEQPSSLYTGVDDDPAPAHEVEQWLARALGVPEHTLHLSDAAAPRGHKRCSNRRIHESGYEFRYPTYREGYAEVLRACST